MSDINETVRLYLDDVRNPPSPWGTATVSGVTYELLTAVRVEERDGITIIEPTDDGWREPVNICEHCHRADWVKVKAYSWEDAAKKGLCREISREVKLT